MNQPIAPRRTVLPAAPQPCAHCPWRRSNQGKPHPGGWYTKANLRRLWAQLRRGEAMTCHPTDPLNPCPDGVAPAPEGAETRECCGSLVLQQREYMRMQQMATSDPEGVAAGLRRYFRENPRGLTREGAQAIVNRQFFAGTPLVAGPAMTTPDLTDRSVYYEPLGELVVADLGGEG